MKAPVIFLVFVVSAVVCQDSVTTLFTNGPASFSLTPAGDTNLTLYLEHTCIGSSIITGIVDNTVNLPRSKSCNNLVAILEPKNYTINGGIGYLYIENLYTRQINLNGNTVDTKFGRVVYSNPWSCQNTYSLLISIYVANSQTECCSTVTGLTGQTALYSVQYLFGGQCTAYCILKRGIVTFSPPVSITGTGPVMKLPTFMP